MNFEMAIDRIRELEAALAASQAECERLQGECRELRVLVEHKHILNLNAMMKIQELETKLKEATNGIPHKG